MNTNNFAKQIEKTCDAQLELSPQEEANGEAPQVQKISFIGGKYNEESNPANQLR